MTDQNAIDSATRRFTQALDLLDADRSKLAADLDAQTAKVRKLETANRDIAQRLDAAMENIRVVLESQD